MNQTLLCWLSAVPAPVLALDVQRGGIPGQPGANRVAESVMQPLVCRPKTAGGFDKCFTGKDSRVGPKRHQMNSGPMKMSTASNYGSTIIARSFAPVRLRNMFKTLDAPAWSIVAVLWICCGLCAASPAEEGLRVATVSPLDHGFTGLYNLDFAGAQRDFATWQKNHPDDPVGPVSEAAGFLFSEFNRLGVLEAQFYENDEAFVERPKLTPDPALRERFEAAIGRAEVLARSRLAKDPKDRDALFALTLSSGLQADYAALIEKRNLASLHFTKQASVSAQELLAVCHDCYDALLATGFSKYVIGSMSAPVRWILRIGGLPADKQGGIADLQITADHGHYLAPFARILLAIAYVREKDSARAMQLLSGLQREFPGNTLFPREIAHLQGLH